MELQRKGWPECVFYSSGIWAARERQKGETDKKNPLTQLPLQKHVEGRQDHEGLKGTERPSMSLCVAMLNRAWKTAMLRPSCALCPGTAVRLRGTLPPGPPGPPGNTSNSQPSDTASSDRRKTPLWPINNYWCNWLDTGSLAFSQAATYYQCSPSFTPLLKLLSQPDAYLQLNNKYRFDCGLSWNVKVN